MQKRFFHLAACLFFCISFAAAQKIDRRSSYEPQFMVLYWRCENNAPGRYFKEQLEENFPVEKLRAMIRE